MNVAFSFHATDTNVTSINFQGTLEAPLFQANQIGALLGIVNIRDTIKDFDEHEKVIQLAQTPGGSQQTLFLTEVGLYRLLGNSRKPQAVPFHKWVASVIKELRVKSKHELEQCRMLAEQGHMLALERQYAKSCAAAKEIAMVSTIALKNERHNVLMRAHAQRPLLYLGCVKELPDGRKIIKYGETDCVARRNKGLLQICGEFTLLDVFPCSEPHKLEQWLKDQHQFKTRKYLGLVNGRVGQEYLAVVPSDYDMLVRFIKASIITQCGWTIEQQLEKARYNAFRHLSDATSDMRAMMESLPPGSTALASLAQEFSVLLQGLSHNTASSVHEVDGRNPQDKSGEHDEGDTSSMEDKSLHGLTDVFVPHDQGTNDVPLMDPKADKENHIDHLVPPPPTKKLGRPPKPKAPLPSDGAPLSRFLEECFTLDPTSKTHCAIVRARHRLWCQSSSRKQTAELCDFFDNHFQNVKETDIEYQMTSSYYKGLALKAWVPPTPSANVFQDDVAAFISEMCEVHVMGRVRTDELLKAFSSWKGAAETMEEKEKQRVLRHMQASFYRAQVPVTQGAECGSGFFGVYLNSASEECREVGYNRSPNTRTCILKLDSRGTLVHIIDSLQDFAKSVMGKSNVYASTQFTKCWADNMRGMVLQDGYTYMRAKDHDTLQALRGGGESNKRPRASTSD